MPPKFDDDVCVSRDEILKYFSPPPSKPTFFRWVNEGKIKKARDLQGYYLLNATLVHQGMPPVDTKKYLEAIKKQPQGLRRRQLLYLAALSAMPELKETDPPFFPVPEHLCTKDLNVIEKFAQSIKTNRKGTTEDEELYYMNGFLDAILTLDIDDPETRHLYTPKE